MELTEKQIEALRKVVEHLQFEIEMFAIQCAEGGSGRRAHHIGQSAAILKAALIKKEEQ